MNSQFFPTFASILYLFNSILLRTATAPFLVYLLVFFFFLAIILIIKG